MSDFHPVSGCNNCSMAQLAEYQLCQHPDAPVNNDIINIKDSYKPDWCPLRVGSLEIILIEQI